MFYATEIAEISGEYAIDTRGATLRFIGYLPVKVGDMVFTDGTVIFGNAKVKGGYHVFDEKILSGVPVLGSRYLLSSDVTILRGYLTERGKYKKYEIAGRNWIVNSKGKYIHDLSGEDIIDAYISDNGEEFIVTNGSYKKSQSISFHYPVVVSRVMMSNTIYKGSRFDSQPYDCALRSRYPQPYPIILGSDDFGNENIPVQILKKDNSAGKFELEQEFDLTPYASAIEILALQCSEEIESQSYNYNGEGFSWAEIVEREKAHSRVEWNPNTGSYEEWEELLEMYPDEYFLPADAQNKPSKFIAHTTAHILSCNVSENGFSGIVFAVSYGYCFPNIPPRFLYLLPRDYPSSSYMVHAPLQEWKCVPFGASALYAFENGVMSDIIYSRKFGGIDSDLTTIGEDGCLINAVSDYWSHGDLSNVSFQEMATTCHVQILPVSTATANKKLLPVGEGFYQMNQFGQLTFYDSEQNKIAEGIPVHDNFSHIEMGASWYETGTYQLDYERYPEIVHADYCLRVPFNDKPDAIIGIEYTPTGETFFVGAEFNTYVSDSQEHLETADYASSTGDTRDIQFGAFYCADYKAEDDLPIHRLHEDIKDNEGNATYYSSAYITPPFDGYYIKQGGTLEPLQFTPLFYKLKDGSYLYGVKGGKLYRKIKDTETVIGDDIKNFRLRELKDIRKAKT